MSGQTNLTPYAIHCDRCRRFGGVVLQATGMALIPRGWETQRVHGRGMTDYSSTDLLCDSCVVADRESRPVPSQPKGEA